ncbi:MAG: hypothetical protein EOO05_11120, partial [Chitinophagaceae bacterium]
MNCFKTRLLPFLFLWLFFSRTAHSQNVGDSLIITTRLLSVEDGMASREVFCAIQDNDGFMWFGTRNGLNRYDGKSTRLFSKQKGGLAENRIIQLAKDNHNRLYIVYGNPGLARSTMRIEVMDLSTYKITSLKEALPDLPFDEKNVYWIANGGSDLCFLVRNPFRYWRLTSTGFKLMCEMKVWDQIEPQATQMTAANIMFYGATGAGCQFYQDCALLGLGENRPRYFVSPDEVIVSPFVNGLLIDSRKKLTNSLEEVSNGLVPYTHKGDEKIAPTSTKSLVYFLLGDYPVTLVYREKDGLFLYDYQSVVKLLSPEQFTIGGGYAFYSFYIDRQDNIWVCTANGLYKIKLTKNLFTAFFSKRQLHDSTDNQVRGIYADGSNTIYAAAWNRLWITREGRYHLKETGQNNVFYGLCRHQGQFYVGEKDLYRLSPGDNGGLVKLTDVNLREIWSLDSLSPDRLLVGSTSSILRYDVASRQLSEAISPPAGMPAPQFVYRFIRRKDKTIWAVAQNGLYLLDQKAETIIDYFGESGRDAAHQLPLDILLDAYEDESGVIWFATNGSGLFRLDQGKKSYRQFNTADGLVSDILYRIEPDRFGNLWISTDNGILKFNTGDFKTTSFSTRAGITHNEFNRASSFRAADGEIFFGGLDGVTAFNPKDFQSDPGLSPLPLRIISFSKFSAKENRLVDQTDLLLTQKQITLLPGEKFFNLEFKLLDFEEGRLNYAYMIKGIDKEWNATSENSIRISGLPYGEYTLVIRGQTHNGQWSTTELTIPISVVRPFYLTYWFLLLAGALLAIIIVLLYKRHVRGLVTAKLALEKEVLTRTGALKDSLAHEQTLLREKDVLLKEIHHRVKNNLQVISGLLELQEKTLTDEQAKAALQEGRNRVRSIALIHQNLYQYETLSRIEVRSFIHDLFNQISVMFGDKAATSKARIDVPVIEIDIDTAVPFGLALNELLTNSFKYGFAGNQLLIIDITLSVENHGNGTGKKFLFVYKDNGPGLPPGYDVSNSKSLGMRLIKDLSKQMGG